MAQYPIQTQEDLVEAVNYLLSGPSGTGQSFNGFSSYDPVRIRPTKTLPFSVAYESTINSDWSFETSINNITLIPNPPGDAETLELTFTSPFATAPFQFGDQFVLIGVTPADFNGDYVVRSCTTTTMVVAPIPTRSFPSSLIYSFGGTIFRDLSIYIDTPVSTDCNAVVTVDSGDARVFISAQLDFEFDVTSGITPADFDIVVQINRYRGSLENNLPSNTLSYNPAQYFSWTFDKTVSQRVYNYTINTASETYNLETIFTQIFDGPAIASDYYWYRLEVMFVLNPTYLPKYGSRTGGLPSNKQYTLSGDAPPSTYDTPQNFSGLSPTSVTGTGVGGVVDVFYLATASDPTYGGYDQVSTITGGSGYSVGDQLLITGDQLGGVTPDNDMMLTVDSVDYVGSAFPGTFTAKIRSLAAQVVKQ